MDVRNFKKNIDIVVIASSTGGPASLEKVLKQISETFPAPILIVQHMLSAFTKSFATTLNSKCKLEVVEAKDGMSIKKGKIFIAPGGIHMKVENYNNEKIIKLEDGHNVNGVKPAADVLFESVSKVYQGKNILAIIFTGMGKDGMKGVEKLKDTCNCYCISQSEKTCVVYGMPKSVYDAGLSDEVVDLQNIAMRMEEII